MKPLSPTLIRALEPTFPLLYRVMPSPFTSSSSLPIHPALFLSKQQPVVQGVALLHASETGLLPLRAICGTMLLISTDPLLTPLSFRLNPLITGWVNPERRSV